MAIRSRARGLRGLMDAIFGPRRFRNELVWERYGAHNDAKGWGRTSDRILHYAGEGAAWSPQHTEIDDETLDQRYRHSDGRGRYTTSPLQARALSGGGYRYEWRGVDDLWKFPKARLDALDADGRIHWPVRGRIPRRKVYLSESRGRPVSEVWTDVGIVAGNERVGFATQKPVALYRRIVRASSRPGDVVFDPFAGSGTTALAAETEGRRWIAADRWEGTPELTRERLEGMELGAQRTLALQRVVVTTEAPVRTDAGGGSGQRGSGQDARWRGP